MKNIKHIEKYEPIFGGNTVFATETVKSLSEIMKYDSARRIPVQTLGGKIAMITVTKIRSDPVTLNRIVLSSNDTIECNSLVNFIKQINDNGRTFWRVESPGEKIMGTVNSVDRAISNLPLRLSNAKRGNTLFIAGKIVGGHHAMVNHKRHIIDDAKFFEYDSSLNFGEFYNNYREETMSHSEAINFLKLPFDEYGIINRTSPWRFYDSVYAPVQFTTGLLSTIDSDNEVSDCVTNNPVVAAFIQNYSGLAGFYISDFHEESGIFHFEFTTSGSNSDIGPYKESIHEVSEVSSSQNDTLYRISGGDDWNGSIVLKSGAVAVLDHRRLKRYMMP